MGQIISQDSIMKLLDWSYDKAVNGLPGMGTADEMAKEYLKSDESLEKQIDKLIRMQDVKSGSSGFITGLGGFAAMPVTIPANLASALYIQLRMIAAIAYMCGFDIKSDQVKTLVYVCLTGNAASEIFKEVGIQVGKKLLVNQIKHISRELIVKINQKVGFRLLTKFGEKGIINLGKAIPILGGVIGGTVDLVSTHAIGKIAKKVFYEQGNNI